MPDIWRSVPTYIGVPDFLVADFDGFFVSFKPEHSGDGEETTMVRGGEMVILKGDYRKKAEKLGPEGFDACFEYFRASKKRKFTNFEGLE